MYYQGMKDRIEGKFVGFARGCSIFLLKHETNSYRDIIPFGKIFKTCATGVSEWKA